MKPYLIHVLFTAACVTGCWDAAFAQAAPATILKIGTENFTIYLNDETDFAKLATNAEQTRAKPYTNFATLIILADIVAVNGKPARGLHHCRGLHVNMSLNPNP